VLLTSQIDAVRPWFAGFAEAFYRLVSFSLSFTLGLSEPECPGWQIRGFWPRGELQEPRQCSIAVLEPCFLSGIRSNEGRAVTALMFTRSLSRSIRASQPIQSGTAGGRAFFRLVLPEAGRHGFTFCVSTGEVLPL